MGKSRALAGGTLGGIFFFGGVPCRLTCFAKSRHNEGRTLLATGMDLMAERKIAKTAERVVTENSFAVDLLIQGNQGQRMANSRFGRGGQRRMVLMQPELVRGFSTPHPGRIHRTARSLF